MSVITMKKLLEAGAHFGHETKRWNPKMAKYIYTKRSGIHIIDLQKTVPLAEKAYEVVREAVKKGEQILFVGTKKQAQDAIEEYAKKCGMPYVNQRWLGGTLTNFEVIKKSVAKLVELEKLEEEGFGKLSKKEISKKRKILDKLRKNFSGLKNMDRLPGMVFIVDTVLEENALKEAKKLKIPIVAITDTNSDPDLIDYPIPGNDDAIRAVALFCELISKAVIDAQNELGEGSFEKDNKELKEEENKEMKKEKEEKTEENTEKSDSKDNN